MVRENRLFLGNPGTGKSTLINCLVKKNLFRAGISYGGGLTKDYQSFELDGVTYMDTPGLADSSIPMEAAAAITEALRKGGKYKLFFMMRLQNGRVVSEDVVTLERVLSAIDVEPAKIRFSVVFNAIDKAQYTLLTKPSSPELEWIKSVVNGRRFKTDAFCLIPAIPALNEASDALGDLPQHVYTFMNREAVSMRINPSEVKTVDPRGLEQQAREVQEEMEQLLRENTAMQLELAPQRSHGVRNSRGRNNAAAPLSPTVNYTRGPPQSPFAQLCDGKPSSSIVVPKKTLLVVAIVIVVVFTVSISLVATLAASKPEDAASKSDDAASISDDSASKSDDSASKSNDAASKSDDAASMSDDSASMSDVTVTAKVLEPVACVEEDKIDTWSADKPTSFFALKGKNTTQVKLLKAQPTPANTTCISIIPIQDNVWYVYDATQPTA